MMENDEQCGHEDSKQETLELLDFAETHGVGLVLAQAARQGLGYVKGEIGKHIFGLAVPSSRTVYVCGGVMLLGKFLTLIPVHEDIAMRQVANMIMGDNLFRVDQIHDLVDIPAQNVTDVRHACELIEDDEDD